MAQIELYLHQYNHLVDSEPIPIINFYMNEQLIDTNDIPNISFRFKADNTVSNLLFLNDYIEIVIDDDNLLIDNQNVQLITNISYHNHNKDYIEFSVLLSGYNIQLINEDIIEIFDRYFVSTELINPISIYYNKMAETIF
jgi:hypothetical protein